MKSIGTNSLIVSKEVNKQGQLVIGRGLEEIRLSRYEAKELMLHMDEVFRFTEEYKGYPLDYSNAQELDPVFDPGFFSKKILKEYEKNKKALQGFPSENKGITERSIQQLEDHWRGSYKQELEEWAHKVLSSGSKPEIDTNVLKNRYRTGELSWKD